jgi:acyl carrier protein
MNDQLRALLDAHSGLPFTSINDDSNLSKDLGLDSLYTAGLVLQTIKLLRVNLMNLNEVLPCHRFDQEHPFLLLD